MSIKRNSNLVLMDIKTRPKLRTNLLNYFLTVWQPLMCWDDWERWHDTVRDNGNWYIHINWRNYVIQVFCCIIHSLLINYLYDLNTNQLTTRYNRYSIFWFHYSPDFNCFIMIIKEIKSCHPSDNPELLEYLDNAVNNLWKC